MGSVFEAFDESLGRKVAIKVLRADLIESVRREEHAARLLREARMLAAVYHPNVLNVYDVGMFEGRVYMAIQYIEGSTLREWIRATSPGWRAILEVYLKVGEGLAEAHKQGLVHRDLKLDDLPEEVRVAFAVPTPDADAVRPLAAVEQSYILAVLELNNGHRTRTAEQLHIGSATLYRELKKFGIADGPP